MFSKPLPLLWLLPALAAVALLALSAGGGRTLADSGTPRYSPAKSGEQRCIHLITSGDKRTLVNVCGTCRRVETERRRPEDATPALRAYSVPANTRVALDLRGPARMRVLREEACQNTEAPVSVGVADHLDCTAIDRDSSGDAVVTNGCDACRVAVLERVYSNGARSRQAMTVPANGRVAISIRGASSGRILADRACATP